MDGQNFQTAPNQPYQSPLSGPDHKKRFSLSSALLSLAYIASFYTGIGAMVSVIFLSISKVFPEVGARYDYYGYYGIETSWPMAILVVSFLVFLITAFFFNKAKEKTEEEGRITGKNVFYLNIFLSALALASSLVTVLYYFFDGREFTTSFILKTLTVLILSGLVFGYYFGEIRLSFSGRGRKLWAALGALCVIFSMSASLLAFGSPRTARLYRADNQKIESLRKIQDQVIVYWRSKQTMPKNMEEMNLSRSLGDTKLPVTDQENKPIVYKLTGDYSFELCAEFNLDAPLDWQKYPSSYDASYSPEKSADESLNNWIYKKGHYCFSRIIDPSIYKPYKY